MMRPSSTIPYLPHPTRSSTTCSPGAVSINTCEVKDGTPVKNTISSKTTQLSLERYIPKGMNLFQVQCTVQESDHCAGFYPFEYSSVVLSPSLELADLGFRHHSRGISRYTLNSIKPIVYIETYTIKAELMEQISHLQAQYGSSHNVIVEDAKESDLLLWLVLDHTTHGTFRENNYLMWSSKQDINHLKEKLKGTRCRVIPFVSSAIQNITMTDFGCR